MIQDVIAREGNRYKRIIVPFTDGNLNVGISADMEDAVRTKGRSVMRDVEKVATLALIDDAWKEHLRDMDDLKDSVQGASFEQKDPLVIYKMEAYNLFERLIGHINVNVTGYLLRGTLSLPSEDDIRQAQIASQNDAARRAQANRLRGVNQQQQTQTQQMAQRAAQSAGQGPAQRVQPIIKDKVVGRNDLCPCGSGKKYKHCHGVN